MIGRRWCWGKKGGAGYVSCDDDRACSCITCVQKEHMFDQNPKCGSQRWKGRARAKRMIDRAYAKGKQS